ncbi:MAG TPA: GTPase domain-containing protein [Holophagaceae bacterium]|nr:GTPase domain-containing protein [Holophagaceae bacterium]
MTAKIVYYGPGLCGKTTNLNTIYGKTSKQARGEMVSLNTETDRTLFFDLLPMDVGTVGGFKTKLQLYTVPGQVFYNSTRKLVLKGVDGIVFVVDSQTAMSDACKDSFLNLQENLKELGLELKDIPIVFQWNKRDLKNVVPVEELEAHFNTMNLPSFQSVASDGTGVFETLRGITRLVLGHIKTHVLGEGAAPAPKPTPVAAPAASGAEALNLSDLPPVSDLLELNTSLVEAAVNAAPDELTDTGLNIEAPELPEHPSALASEPLPDTEDADSLLSEPGLEAPEFDEPAPVAEAAVVPEPAPVAAAPEPEPAHPPVPTMIIPKATAKPKIPTMDKGAIDSLMGELTQVGRLGAPSVLRLEVPDVEGDVEVVVQVLKGGQVLTEQRQTRPAPRKGITSKLSVELKRS